VFGLAVALGAGGLLAAVAAVATAIVSVHHAPAGAGQVVIAGLHFTYPTVNAAAGLLLLLAGLGSSVMIIAVRASWRQRKAHQRLIAQMGFVGTLPGHPGVRVIEDPGPQAFCAGYLRPTVYVSQPTLDLLSDRELEAVLAHERYHLRVRDPLRFAYGRVLSQALFFVPVLRPLWDRYAELAEIRADGAAIRATTGDKAPLASALLALVASSPHGAAGISPERVDSLLGQPACWRLPSWLLTTSIASLSVLSVLTWRASAAAAAAASLNLPILSSRPCLVIVTLMPIAGCAVILARRERGRRAAFRSTQLAIAN
jgi:Zn-dependent protease with chaperone function